MKAMLLAAGEGRRMRPLTERTPKPALPVLGRPLLAQKLQSLAAAGVDEVVINLHHFGDHVRTIVREMANGTLPAIRFSDESEELLGTGGGLRRAAAMLRGDGPFVVCNSDYLANIHIPRVVEAHMRGPQQATLVVAPPRDCYSSVDCDSAGRVRSLAGSPPTPADERLERHLFTGCHVLEESVLERIPEHGPSDIVRDVYRPMATEGSLGSVLHDGFWWEFGSPQLYLEGTMRLLRLPPRELRTVCPDRDPLRRIGEATAAVGAGVAIHDSARLGGHVALGYASHVGADAIVRDSVVMPEAWIGPGADVGDSIIATGVELPAGDVVSGKLVCMIDGRMEILPLESSAR